MQLQALTSPELIFPRLQCSDRSSVLHAMAERVVGQGLVGNADELYERLLEREELGSTGIGSGVAIPHCKLNGLDRVVLAIGLLEAGIDFGAVDNQPVRLIFLVVSPSHSPAAHLQCLAAISKWIKVGEHVAGLLALDEPQAIFRLLREE